MIDLFVRAGQFVDTGIRASVERNGQKDTGGSVTKDIEALSVNVGTISCMALLALGYIPSFAIMLTLRTILLYAYRNTNIDDGVANVSAAASSTFTALLAVGAAAGEKVGAVSRNTVEDLDDEVKENQLEQFETIPLAGYDFLILHPTLRRAMNDIDQGLAQMAQLIGI